MTTLRYCTLKLTTVLEAATFYCIYVLMCIKIKLFQYIYNVCSLYRNSKCVVIKIHSQLIFYYYMLRVI